MAARRVFYGWVVLGAAIAVIAVGFGITFSLAVFLKPLEAEFGSGRSVISGVAFLNWIVFGGFAFLWGTLSDRIGTRRVVLLGGGLLGLAMLASSRIGAVWHLYLTFGILAAAGASAFYVPLSATASRWFTRNRGLALGLVSAGIGIGILTMAPLARALITAYGWRATFLILGLMAWGITVPVVAVLRDRPEEVGLEAYGIRGRAAGRRDDMGVAEAFRQPAFWTLGLIHFVCCAAHSGPLFHMVAHATDLGIPKMAAATMLGVSGASSIAGRIGTGILADRSGAQRTLVGILTLQAAMVGTYLVAHHVLALYLVAVFFGVAYGGVMPLYALVVREFFGDRVMGTAYGGIFLISALGMGLGSYAGGWLFDLQGSYHGLYAASALVGIGAVGLAASLRPPAG